MHAGMSAGLRLMCWHGRHVPVGPILSTTLHLTGTDMTNGVVFEIRLVLGWGVGHVKHIVNVRHVPLRDVAE